MTYFDGDDLFTPWDRAKGLPIGNLTSQLWANTYLSGFDHWVKQSLRAPGYARFVDDFVIFASTRECLEQWREEVSAKLSELRLKLHEKKSVVRRTREGITFLGYVVWPDRIRVRGETVRRYRRKYRNLAKHDLESVSGVAAWHGHCRLAGNWRQTHGLR